MRESNINYGGGSSGPGQTGFVNINLEIQIITHEKSLETIKAALSACAGHGSYSSKFREECREAFNDIKLTK